MIRFYFKKPFLYQGLFLLLSILSAPVYADDMQQTLYERLPPSVKNADAQFFTFTIENDLFGNGEDRNYTNGVRLSYLDYGADIPAFWQRLEHIIPGFALNETSSISYSVGQNMYTPSDITLRNPPLDERPYAGFLYGSAGLTSLNGNHVDDLEIALGVVGPWSFAEQTQEAVHDFIGADDPSGWDNQLENEPAFIASWLRTWPVAHERSFAGLNSRVIPHAGASFGNVYTYASAGATWQLTPSEHSWQAPPPRVRPAIPGNGFFIIPDNAFSWSLFAGVDTRLVGQNIFLDGNSFRDSPSVDKNYTVFDVNGGVTLSYGKMQLSYTLNWRSREYKGQDEPSLFGSISLGRRF